MAHFTASVFDLYWQLT